MRERLKVVSKLGKCYLSRGRHVGHNVGALRHGGGGGVGGGVGGGGGGDGDVGVYKWFFKENSSHPPPPSTYVANNGPNASANTLHGQNNHTTTQYGNNIHLNVSTVLGQQEMSLVKAEFDKIPDAEKPKVKDAFVQEFEKEVTKLVLDFANQLLCPPVAAT